MLTLLFLFFNYTSNNLKINMPCIEIKFTAIIKSHV